MSDGSVFPWPEAVVTMSGRDDTVAGLDPAFEKVWDGPDQVSWFESNHRRIFEVARVISESAELFHFETLDGNRFQLRPMTLELYERHVRKHTVGQPEFRTLGALVAAMRREW